MSRISILGCLVVLVLVARVAATTLTLPGGNSIVVTAGMSSQPIQLSLASPLAMPPASTNAPQQVVYYPVQVTATASQSAGYTIVPSAFTLNANNLYTSSFVLNATGPPPSFSNNGYGPVNFNITFHSTCATGCNATIPDVLFIVQINPLPISVCMQNATASGGLVCTSYGLAPLSLSLVHLLPSGPITVALPFTPPPGTSLDVTVSVNSTRGSSPLVSSSTFSLTIPQPSAQFQLTSRSFSNTGYVSLYFSGSAAAYTYPSLPSVLTFSTQLIPVRLDSPSGTQLLLGVPSTFTVALDLPFPDVQPPGTLTVTPMSTQTGPAAAVFQPSTLTFTSGVMTQSFNVTIFSALPNNTLQMYLSLSPSQYDQGGPFTIAGAGSYEAPLTLRVLSRHITCITPTSDIYFDEPFPLEILLPYPTPNALTLQLDDGGLAAIQYSPNALTFSGTQTQQIVWVTCATFFSPPNPQAPFQSAASQRVTLRLYVTGPDAPLYDSYNPSVGNALISVSVNLTRRTFVAKTSQQLQNNKLVLTPGVWSEPINVYMAQWRLIDEISSSVVLTPFVNLPNIVVMFSPSQLTFTPHTGQAGAFQSIRVMVPTLPPQFIGSTFSVEWALSASAADRSLLYLPTQYTFADFPQFSLQLPAVSVFFPGSSLGAADVSTNTLPVLAGDTVLVVLSLPYLPLRDLTISAFASNVNVSVQNTAALSTPTPNNAAVSISPSTGPSMVVFALTPYAFSATPCPVQFALTGSDAAFYAPPPTVRLLVSARNISLPNVTASASLGDLSNETWLTLSDVPVHDVTVSVLPASPSSGLSVSPASLTFTASSPLSQAFKWRGSVLGSFPVQFVLSGTDAGWYVFNDSRLQTQQLSVTLRAPPVIGFAQLLKDNFSVIQPYQQLGPITVTLQTPVDTDLTVTPYNQEWSFTPASVVFAAGQSTGTFHAQYTPLSAPTSNEPVQTTVFYRLSGTDVWKYKLPTATVLFASPVNINRRPIQLHLPASVIVGVPTYGNVSLGLHPPHGLTLQPVPPVGVVFSPSTFTFTPSIATVHFTLLVTLTPPTFPSESTHIGVSNAVPIAFNVSGADAPLYQVPSTQNVAVHLRQLHVDTSAADGTLHNPFSGGVFGGSTSQFVLNVTYTNLLTLHVTTPPSTAVSVTPSSPYLVFTPPTATFTPTQLTVPLSIRPVAIPPQSVSTAIDWVLSGADELLYDPSQLPTGAFTVVPPVLVSPALPALYADQSAYNLSVSVGAAVSVGVNTEPFVLSVQPVSYANVPLSDAITVTPNTFAFTAAGGSNLTHSFVLSHVRPSGVPAGGYKLQWSFRALSAPSTSAVPLQNLNVNPSASGVQVLKYAIVPDFPFTLGYRFCQAGLNLTRPPWSTLTITPHYGSSSSSEGGKIAGGNVIFDPPVITFPPGVSYQTFQVRADRRIDDTALYLKVDYTVNAHPEDAACYLPFPSTWHVAASKSLQASLVALLIIVTMSVLLM